MIYIHIYDISDDDYDDGRYNHDLDKGTNEPTVSEVVIMPIVHSNRLKLCYCVGALIYLQMDE